jgi:HEAT repeat protein
MLEPLLLASGSDPGPAVAALIRALAACEPHIRSKAAEMLGRCGNLAGIDPPDALVLALDDPSDMVRSSAAVALARFGRGFEPTLPALLRRFAVDIAAAQIGGADLVARSPNPSALPDLIAGLSSPSWRVRSLSATLLGHIGQPAAPSIPALLASLRRSADEPISDWVMPIGRIKEVDDPLRAITLALMSIGAGPEVVRGEVVPLLGRSLRNGADTRRWNAVTRSLEEFGPVAEPVVPDLIEIIRSKPGTGDQIDAADILVTIASGTGSDQQALDAILAAMKNGLERYEVDRPRQLRLLRESVARRAPRR